MHDASSLITQLPKCELHIHIEGSLELEMMFALARCNGVRLPYESVDALRRVYQLRNLQDFLYLYYQGISCRQCAARRNVLRSAKPHLSRRRMMDKGLVVTLNSDDPVYFGGYVGDNYRAVSDALLPGREEITAITRNGVQASLLPPTEKATLQPEIDRVLAQTA